MHGPITAKGPERCSFLHLSLLSPHSTITISIAPSIYCLLAYLDYLNTMSVNLSSSNLIIRLRAIHHPQPQWRPTCPRLCPSGPPSFPGHTSGLHGRTGTASSSSSTCSRVCLRACPHQALSKPRRLASSPPARRRRSRLPPVAGPLGRARRCLTTRGGWYVLRQWCPIVALANQDTGPRPSVLLSGRLPTPLEHPRYPKGDRACPRERRPVLGLPCRGKGIF